MYKGYKIVCVTPVRRRRYLRILASYVLSVDIVDRWDLWINTENEKDIKFIEFLKNLFPNKINLVPHPERKINGCLSIGDFFRYCIEEDTIYMRLDDDIVWIEDNFFQNFLDERIKNREFF